MKLVKLQWLLLMLCDALESITHCGAVERVRVTAVSQRGLQSQVIATAAVVVAFFAVPHILICL